MPSHPIHATHPSLRHALVVLIGAAPLLLFAAEPPHATPAQQVEALHAAFGTHHARAVHAKGIVVEGTFEPSAEARSLSAAALFAEGRLPVVIRFSDFTGLPNISDTDGLANPRGLAVKFTMKNGEEADLVAHSFNGFPVATSDEFAELMRAVGASGAEAAKPTALDRFLDSHPQAKTFLTTQKPAPVSYCTLSYFGVNAFGYTNAQQKRTVVRYRFIPTDGEQLLDAATVKSKGPDYLSEELPARLNATTMRFDWFAQIATSADAIDNPSVAWPETRKLVKLGTITLARVAPNQQAINRSLLFLPSRVPSGIDVADPMIAVRGAAYPISFGQRQ